MTLVIKFSLFAPKRQRAGLYLFFQQGNFMKNLVLLIALVFVAITYAKDPIERESLADAENFKVEKAVEQKAAKRTISGAKAKKGDEEVNNEEITTSEDSDVHFWKYSEE